MPPPIEIRVELPGRAYDILVGPGLLREASARLNHFTAGKSCAVVSDDSVAELYMSSALSALAAAGAGKTFPMPFPPGEPSKNLSCVGALWSRMASAGLDRSSVVVGLGGGVPGDVAGFAASAFMRGIDFIQIPTTLLAMVDSSVGGKTGVDLPEGKNLVGAFWQPRLVLADTDTLRTLPPREIACGLAEVVKYGVISDPSILDLAEADSERLRRADPELMPALVARCCAIKAAVVVKDERESGPRAFLNFGHTFGHAVEKLLGFSGLNHGEAISVGMAMAARLAADIGLCGADLSSRLERILASLGLPTRAPGLAPAAILDAMRGDKKSQSGRLRLVLPAGPGDVRLVNDAPESAVLAAIATGV